MTLNPQKPPRVAVIGCGAWGRNHVRNYAELGALEAIVDRHEDTVHALLARHGGRALAFEDALADPAIQAFSFAMPPREHYRLGREALLAGKHVLLEKPMALTAREGEELAELAEARGLVLMVGHVLQYHPAFQALLDLVRSGRLGRLMHVSSRRLAFGRMRRPEDALWELAPHDLSMMLALTGSEPEGVQAVGAYHLDPEIADMASVQLAFPGGVTGEVWASWLNPVKEHRLIVVGSEGMAVFDDAEPWERKLVLYPHRVETREDGLPMAVPGAAEPVEVASGEPLKRELSHFLDSIRAGTTPCTDGREGVRVLRVLERASAAMKAHRRG